MKLGIHFTKNSFCERWVAYCDQQGIAYKIVNCYASDIIEHLKDCDALLWHHQQGSAKDILFAKQLLFALQQSGKVVFPDFNSNWHFDDKVGQKYLLEALEIKEFVPTWVFYSKSEAHAWAIGTRFPKVFKLRGGAGSQNVKLVRTMAQAKRLINRAFGKGFSPYDGWGSLKERTRKYRLGKMPIWEVIKGIVRLVVPPPYARIMGRERGYVYFQEFMPNNDFDIRIIVIDGKAFALKRFVRENDFRASGSGSFKYEKEEFDERCISLAFNYTNRLQAQCVAYDFVFDEMNPRLIEINYGFAPSGYDGCPGYWDSTLAWHEGKFDPYGWMVEMVIQSKIEKKSISGAF
jgi:glutathione synthase/RimK-type ligase-like ATP-grasp enzyme